jgi:hypothetical protein
MADVKNLPNKQAGAGLSYKGIALLGISKVASERVAIKLGAGNGTLKSGLIKVGVGVGGSLLGFTSKYKALGYIGAGVTLDGVEDMANVVLSKAPINTGNSNKNIA